MAHQETSIVVGIDFSPGSERAIAEAVSLAKRLQASLHVVHVYEPYAATTLESTAMYEDVLAGIARERTARCRQGVELCDRMVAGKVPYTFHVVDAMPLDGLLEVISKLKPELAIVGSHGRGAIKRMLFGSVSSALCHRSPVPVLVVPPAAQAA